jgi:hypothetical protein
MRADLAGARAALLDLMQESQRAKLIARLQGPAEEPPSLSQRLDEFVKDVRNARVVLPEAEDAYPAPQGLNGGAGGGVKRSADEMMMGMGAGGGGGGGGGGGQSYGAAAATGAGAFTFAASTAFPVEYTSEPSSALEMIERASGAGDRPAALGKRVIKATPKVAEQSHMFATEHNPERAELMGSFVRNPLPTLEGYTEIARKHGRPVDKIKTSFKNLRSKYRAVAVSSTGQQLLDTVLKAFLAEIGDSPTYAETKGIADLTGATHEEFVKALKERNQQSTVKRVKY